MAAIVAVVVIVVVAAAAVIVSWREIEEYFQIPHLLEKVYKCEAVINAPPKVVYEILTNLKDYPKWNPMVVKAESTFQPGSPMRMHVMFHGLKIIQEETVEGVSEDKLVWGFKPDQYFGTIQARRVQSLTELDDGPCHYVTEDAIWGPLSFLVHLFFGPILDENFARFTKALKTRAELV
mmetsp:Transcript_10713/g.19848  ORF Transcript_10713/g.19848 Transcript_10713/m.19848 type:complete len:179 (-) Transcript_10713:79-615(-)